MLTPEGLEALTNLQRDMIRKIAQPITPKDKVIIGIARQLITDRYQNGRHHLAACGWGREQAEPYSALQLNCKRARESSVCAEAGVMVAASMKNDELLTLVTFHGDHGSENGERKPYVVPPCAMCVTRFQRFAPNCDIIVEFEETLVKIPQQALMLLPYPMDDKK